MKFDLSVFSICLFQTTLEISETGTERNSLKEVVSFDVTDLLLDVVSTSNGESSLAFQLR